jgi:Fe-S cluster assembly protein SufD
MTIAKERIEFRKNLHFEPEWLYRMRKESWESHLSLPLPDRTKHLWRYSDPRLFLIENPHVFMDIIPPIMSSGDGDRPPSSKEYAAIGYNQPDMSTIVKLSPELKESGVILKSLIVASKEDEEIVVKYLGRLVGHDFGKFEAANMALWNTGFLLYIPDNVSLEKPILLNRHPAHQFTPSRLLIAVGKNSRATIIDDYSGTCKEENPASSNVAEIFGEESSQVRYVNLQRLAPECRSYMTHRAEIGRGANIYSIFGTFGGTVSKINAGVVLNGRGADSRMYGVVFGDERQALDFHTLHHHKQNDSTSNIDVKVVLKDKATSAYTGLIKIDKETANCEAYQENRNLLLNAGTKAESIPELEIMTDQVRCTHGATMGPVDPEALFYLKSRGISQNEALKIIVSGFVEPTVNQIPAELRHILRNLVASKLERIPE